MSNPTSNFGWVMPSPTDLVTDLPADFEVFGQAVDTSMADLKGGTTGQILSKASNTDMDFTWITNDVGDITAVNAGNGLSGGGTSGSVTLSIDTTYANVFTAAQTATAFIVTGATVATNGIYLPAANTLDISTNSTRAIRVSSTQQVGIGMSPATTLDVTGTNVRLTPGSNTATNGFTFNGSSSNALWATMQSYKTQIDAVTRFEVLGSGITSVGTSAGSAMMQIVNIGSNTANPVLLVKGAASQTGDLLQIQNSAALVLAVVNSSGQVGIGTTTPTYTLDVRDNNSSGSYEARLTNASTANNTTKFSGLLFAGFDTSGTIKSTAAIQSIPADSNNVGSNMAFFTRGSDTFTERMRIDSAGNITSNGGGIGYGTGAGGTVTQATSKATGVTLSKVTGQITMNNAALAANTSVSFTLTNTTIAATDMILVQHISAGTVGAYVCSASPAAGSATIYVRNVTAGSLSEAIVLQYAVIKAVTA